MVEKLHYADAHLFSIHCKESTWSEAKRLDFVVEEVEKQTSSNSPLP